MCYSLSASIAALIIGMISAAVVATEAEARPLAYSIAWISLVQAAEAMAYAYPSSRGAVARALILLLGTQLIFLAPSAKSVAVCASVGVFALVFACTAAFAQDVPAVQVNCSAAPGCRMEWPFLQGWIGPMLTLQYVVMAVLLYMRRKESPAYTAAIVAGAISLGLSLTLRNSPASPWCMFAALCFPIVAGAVLWKRFLKPDAAKNAEEEQTSTLNK